MGPHLSTLQFCNTPADISDFARNLSGTFAWKDEYRSVGVLNAVVDKGHLVQDPHVVELVGKFFSGFAADSHGAKLAATPAVYALLVQHCFKYATTSDSLMELGFAMSILASRSNEGRNMMTTAETVNAINNALNSSATTAASVEKLGSAIHHIASNTNDIGKKLFCIPAIRSSVNNALNKFADSTSCLKSVCSVIKTLCKDYKPGQDLFSNEDCAAAIIGALHRNVANPERILELMRAVASITKCNEEGQRIYFTPTMGLAIANAFDLATTAAHITQLSDAVREVVFLSEGVTETLFMTPSLVAAFARILMSVSASSESREAETTTTPSRRAPALQARVNSLTVTRPLGKLLEGNPVGVKIFAVSKEFLDELKRIEDFSNASDSDAIRSVRQLRLLLLTDTWGGPFVTSCVTDPGDFCCYCWFSGFSLKSAEYPCEPCCCMAMMLVNVLTVFVVPPVPCMMGEAFLFRRHLKRKYNISESQWYLLGACLLPCCAAAQHMREVRRRGDDVNRTCCAYDPSQVDPNDPVLVANNGPVRPRPKVQIMGEMRQHREGDVEMKNRHCYVDDNNNDDIDNSHRPRPRLATPALASIGNDDETSAPHVVPCDAEHFGEQNTPQNGAAMNSTFDNRNTPSNDEVQQAAALSHAYPPEACFVRGVPRHLTFNDSVSALLSLRELPTDENGDIARPDLEDWIPTNADVDRVLRFIDRQLPGVKNRPAVQQLISRSNLADDDIRALILMKMAHPFPVSKFLNAWLAGQRRDNKIAQTAGPIFTRIYRAMEKLPKIKRAATRGVIVGQIPALRATFDNYRTRCAPGKTMSFWGFSSFALENSVGSTYFTGSLNQESIIYKADVEGVGMEPFKPDGMPDEAEILPFCPAVFEIVSAEKAGAKLIIKLKQLKHEEFSYVEPMNGR